MLFISSPYIANLFFSKKLKPNGTEIEFLLVKTDR